MPSTKTVSFSILAAGVLIASAVLFTDLYAPKRTASMPSLNNAYIQGGKQTIEITAKGGFNPKNTVAKSGVPTTLKITTKGTFDCSSAVSIPELNIVKNLPNTGITEIDLGTREPGILSGTCGMGMYPFEINFI